jgi:hypothetical protein
MSFDRDPDRTIDDFFYELKNKSKESNLNLQKLSQDTPFRNFKEENNKYLRKLYFETGAQVKKGPQVEPPKRRDKEGSKNT